MQEIDPNLQPTFTYGIVSAINDTANPVRGTITISGSIVPATQTVCQYISIPVPTIEFVNVLEQRQELMTPEDDDD